MAENITWSLVFANPGRMHQVSGFKVVCDRPQIHMLAGFCSDEARPRAAAIVYHAGRRAWALETESFRQKANTMRFGRLDELLGLLADYAGTAVLPITVDDNVIGRYKIHPAAQTARNAA